MVRRSGFTLMELIITIVLLGIIFSAIPMILTQNQKASNQALSQEAIYAGVTKMSQLLTYHWDEHSIKDDPNLAIVYAKVLDANLSGDHELSRHTKRYRIGHFEGSSRRSFFPSPTYAVAFADLGKDAPETLPDDIDDFIANNQDLIAIDNEHGYKQTYLVDVSVNYASDLADYNQTTINGFAFDTINMPSPTNIKRITLAVSLNNQRQFQLESFISNIGETDIVSKVFP